MESWYIYNTLFSIKGLILMCLYILICIYAHMYKNSYMHIYLYLSWAKQEFMLTTPSQIHYHMDCSTILPCLMVTSYCTNEKLGSPHPPFIYLITPLQYTRTVVSELTTIPVGNTFIKYGAHMKFLLPLVLQTLLISKVTQVSSVFSYPVQWVCSICLWYG